MPTKQHGSNPTKIFVLSSAKCNRQASHGFNYDWQPSTALIKRVFLWHLSSRRSLKSKPFADVAGCGNLRSMGLHALCQKASPDGLQPPPHHRDTRQDRLCYHWPDTRSIKPPSSSSRQKVTPEIGIRTSGSKSDLLTWVFLLTYFSCGLSSHLNTYHI